MLKPETRDPLTQVLTREAFLEQCTQVLETEPIFSVALLDLDFFKTFNDTHGHAVGDQYITKAANILHKNLRQQDILARYDGEAFAILMPDTPPESAFMLLEDIRRLLSEREFDFQQDDRKVRHNIAFSGGIASNKDGKTISDLLRAADEALYRAKIAGRNRLSLAITEKMKTKTSYYTQAQLARLAELSKQQDMSEAVLLREALDDLLHKYKA